MRAASHSNQHSAQPKRATAEVVLVIDGILRLVVERVAGSFSRH